jgi:hypothetical protein
MTGASTTVRSAERISVVAGELDHGRTEPVREGHGAAVGELPLRFGPAGDDDAGRRRSQGLDVRPVMRGRADQRGGDALIRAPRQRSRAYGITRLDHLRDRGGHRLGAWGVLPAPAIGIASPIPSQPVNQLPDIGSGSV